MVLLLRNEDLDGLISMWEHIEALDGAFCEFDAGTAATLPRARIYLPRSRPDAKPESFYWHNNIVGASPTFGVLAVRIDSAQVRFTSAAVDGAAGGGRLVFEGERVGLVLLYSLANAELLGILEDHVLSVLRVGATSALGARCLARRDAAVVGLFGAGEQARTQLQGLCAVRPVETVRVYSPTATKREPFAARMAAELGVEVRPVDAPRQAVEGCDIVVTATNANQPVFNGNWLASGQHVITLNGSDAYQKRQEIDQTTVRRSSVIVVNYLEQIQRDEQPEIFTAVQKGILRWEQIHELGAVLRGRVAGRTNDYQITLHDNNVGMGIQFATIGAQLLKQARERGRGRELPLDFFRTPTEGTHAP